MTPNYPKYLTQLGIRSLATGSPHVDTDTFVNWCAALAAVAHPGSKLVRSGIGQGISIGLDTLTCATAIAGIETHVIGHLREIQNQHLRNTEARAASAYDMQRETRHPGKKAEARRSEATGLVHPVDLAEMDNGPGDPSKWIDRVESSQLQAELAIRPAFFVEGSNPHQLSEYLKCCHLGKVLAAVRVPDAKSMASNDMVFRGITEGVSLGTNLPYQVSGRVIATMPATLLNEMAPSAVGQGGVIGSTLWLTGMTWGDSPWPQRPSKSNCAWGKLFGIRLRAILHVRFCGDPVELPVSAATCEKIAGFTEQLHFLETRMPGIANSLRSLLPTLIFGLSVLNGCHREREKALSDDAIDVLVALATSLADRMVEHYLSIVDAEHMERVRRHAGTVLQKLQERPHSVRELTRRVYKLKVEDAKEALDHLESRGLVIQSDSTWHLNASPSCLLVPDLQPSTSYED